MGLRDKIKSYMRKRKIEKAKKNPAFLMKEKNQDEELQLVAVNNHDYMIRYFPNASIKVQLAHIARWGGMSLFSIPNPSNEAVFAAMEDDFKVFSMIVDPNDDICKKAIDMNVNSFKLIKMIFIDFFSIYTYN